MIIGLISDSHGSLRKLAAAMKILTAKRVQTVVHCGDICCFESVGLLGSLGIPAWLVAGNMDDQMEELEEAAEASKVAFSRRTVEVPLAGGEYLVATHGNDENLLHELILGRQFPYVCHGHTHRIGNQKLGRTRVICSGAIKGPRGPKFPTVSILNTDLDQVEFYDIRQPNTPIRITL